VEREADPQMFVSLAQNPPRSVDILIQTSSDDPLVMAGPIRAAVRGVEKNAPIYGVAPLEQQLGTYLSQRRFQTSLLTGFSIVALLMAAVGIRSPSQCRFSFRRARLHNPHDRYRTLAITSSKTKNRATSTT
jgi:hypothetical protein